MSRWLRERRRLVDGLAVLAGVLVAVALIPFAGGSPRSAGSPAPVAASVSSVSSVDSAPVPAGPAARHTTASRCRDDGRSGRRIEALYVHGRGQRDRYRAQLPVFRRWLDQVDQAFVRAARTHSGGVRHPRYLRDGRCRTVVRDVTVSPDELRTVDTITAAIQAQGYDRTDRHYIVWYENPGCGVGFGNGGDDDPSPANAYNSGPHYAAVGTDCWGWAPTLHELLHTLGAVAAGAPHGTANGHCWDDEDVMCYDDGSLPRGGLSVLCPENADDDRATNQIDCHGDDYFNTRPTRGSYLATHWNTADSLYLYRS